MKRLYLLSGLGTILALAWAPKVALAQSGVGALATDKVYSVEVIAHSNCPTQEFDNSNRRSIAVRANYNDSVNPNEDMNLTKVNAIFLTPGAGFQVLDGNACDSNGALLQLPPDVASQFQIYVRLVGKPNSKIDVATCATVPATGTIVCSTNEFAKTRLTGKGQPSFTNATPQLTTIVNASLVGTLCGTGTVSLFNACLVNYFWDWDTFGRPHAQVWFVQQ
jgi:hypothetical protein